MPFNILNRALVALNIKLNFPHNRSKYLKQIISQNFDEPSIMEIGVFEGDLSWDVFVKLEPKLLALVDPYRHYHLNRHDHDIEKLDQRYNRVKKRFKNFSNCKIFRNTLEEVIQQKKFPAGTFDIIYIDGDHSFEGAYNDLINSEKLLTKSGFIILDDYGDFQSYGIRKAVNQFLAEYMNYYIFGLQYNQLVLKRFN